MAGGLLPRRPARWTRQTAAGVVACALQLLLFWHGVHALRDAIHVHPLLVLLFPMAAIAFLAFLLPALVFLSMENDFYGLNPLNPLHYLKICRRTYGALVSNSWKIGSKDM